MKLNPQYRANHVLAAIGMTLLAFYYLFIFVPRKGQNNIRVQQELVDRRLKENRQSLLSCLENADDNVRTGLKEFCGDKEFAEKHRSNPQNVAIIEFWSGC